MRAVEYFILLEKKKVMSILRDFFPQGQCYPCLNASNAVEILLNFDLQ